MGSTRDQREYRGAVMQIRLQIRYYTEDESWLCFRHAVLIALKGEVVSTSIDDYGSDYYLGVTYCTVCDKEEVG